MTDFTIIIPHRGNSLGLWSTIQSCDDDLINARQFKWNYVIVTNGQELVPEETGMLKMLEKSGRLLKHIHSDEPLSPPVARQRGAAEADGRLLCFLDNHCLVGRHFFERAALDFAGHDMDMLHSTTVFYTGDGHHYEYKLRLDYNFWGESKKVSQSYKPYRIAVGGHGGFFVKKEAWDAVGGYGPESLLNGYGGEEVLFDLQMWQMGKSNWLDPKLVHHHFTGQRGYSRHWTNEYYINLMVSASVIGGDEWLYKVFESLTTRGHIRFGENKDKPFYELLQIAQMRAKTYADELGAKRLMTLNELLRWFRDENIAM